MNQTFKKSQLKDKSLIHACFKHRSLKFSWNKITKQSNFKIIPSFALNLVGRLISSQILIPVWFLYSIYQQLSVTTITLWTLIWLVITIWFDLLEDFLSNYLSIFCQLMNCNFYNQFVSMIETLLKSGVKWRIRRNIKNYIPSLHNNNYIFKIKR